MFRLRKVAIIRRVCFSTHASQVTICSHNTDDVLCGLYVSTFNQVCNF